MQVTIKRGAVSAALLCGAMLISGNSALGEGGGGDPTPPVIIITPSGTNEFHGNQVLESLTRARLLIASNGTTPTVNRRFNVTDLNGEAFRRRLFRDDNFKQLLISLPAFGGDSPNLTPPTGSTPEPTASSGNCGQPGAACANEETRRRQTRKAETKRAQRAFAAWAQQQGIAR